jgi:AraC family transcriptional regulator
MESQPLPAVERRGWKLVPAAERKIDGAVAAEFIVDGPAVLDAHAHDRPSLSFLFSGGYCLHAGGVRIEASAPMATYLPDGFERSVSFHPGRSQFLWVQLPPDLSARLPEIGASPCGFVPFGPDRSQWLASRLVVEMRKSDPASSYLLRGMLLELFGELVRRLDGTDDSPPQWIATAMSILHAAGRRAPIAEVARRCRVHPTHLSRAFRKHFGCTPSEYVRQQRVAQARLLLLSVSTPLAEIAAECGFADQAHLTREFRRVVGTSPGRFRRLLRRD